MEMAENPDVQPAKRQFMLDTVTFRNAMPGIIDRLSAMLDSEKNSEILDAIVGDTLFYFQHQMRGKSPKAEDMEKVRSFFERILQRGVLTQKQADSGVMGYVQTHSADEVVANLERINAALAQTHHVASLQNKYSLAFKSPRLQTLFIQSIVDELEAVDDSEFDGYFLGPLSIGLEHTGPTLLNPASQEVIRAFLRDRESRYNEEGIAANKKDYHRGFTAPSYNKVKAILK